MTMFVVLAVLGALYGLYSTLTSTLPHHFVIPPRNWKQKITDVLDYPKPIYLKVGTKRSSFRRRLILASCQPSYYTNFVNNKLKINPNEDRKEFLENMTYRDPKDARRKLIYGFFHPYANNGGGGERVLWQAVKATLEADPKNVVAVYTTNLQDKPLEILDKTTKKFQVDGLDSSRIVFIYLRRFGHLIDSNYWKHFTLIGQLFGTILLTLEAMHELSPDIWIDTIGLPASYWPISKILHIPILAYVHYPIIQQDMFNKLKFPTFSFKIITQTRSLGDIKQVFKLVYWSLLYWFYVYLGSFVSITLTNGSWTQNHMTTIWHTNRMYGQPIDKLYPPCGTETMKLEGSKDRENKLLYISQFRPEKRHLLLLEEYAKFLKCFKLAKLPISKLPTIVFLGSCRTPDDTKTLDEIKSSIKKLQLEEYVELVVDCAYRELVQWLTKVEYGVNAMWNEHFGIGVVEYLCGGAIPIVHASAGPLLDIVGSDNDEWNNDIGFFFKDKSDADFKGEAVDDMLEFDNKTYPTFNKLLTMLFIETPSLVSAENNDKKRKNGYKSLDKFSNSTFETKWKHYAAQLQLLEVALRMERLSEIEMVY